MAGRFDWGSVARRTGSVGCLADSASAKYPRRSPGLGKVSVTVLACRPF